MQTPLVSGAPQRDEVWSKSLAVGRAEYVLKIQLLLGARGRGRDIAGAGDSFMLREPRDNYMVDFNPDNRPIASNNTYLWEMIS
jgi:putative transposase